MPRIWHTLVAYGSPATIEGVRGFPSLCGFPVIEHHWRCVFELQPTILAVHDGLLAGGRLEIFQGEIVAHPVRGPMAFTHRPSVDAGSLASGC